MSGAYISIDPELICLREGHRFQMFGSDSKPMSRSLLCVNCSAALGKTAVVAYGEPKESFGQWRTMRRHEETVLDEVIE